MANKRSWGIMRARVLRRAAANPQKIGVLVTSHDLMLLIAACRELAAMPKLLPLTNAQYHDLGRRLERALVRRNPDIEEELRVYAKTTVADNGEAWSRWLLECDILNEQLDALPSYYEEFSLCLPNPIPAPPSPTKPENLTLFDT